MFRLLRNILILVSIDLEECPSYVALASATQMEAQMQLHVLHAPHGIEGVAQEWRVVLDGDPSLEGTVRLANEVLRSCRTANPQAQIIAINEVALLTL